MRRFWWRSAGDLAVAGAFAVLVVAGGVFAVRSGGSLARAATATPAELVGVAALAGPPPPPPPGVPRRLVFRTGPAPGAGPSLISAPLPPLPPPHPPADSPPP